MAELSTARPAPLPGFDTHTPSWQDFQDAAGRVSGLIEAARLLLNEGGEHAAAAWPVLAQPETWRRTCAKRWIRSMSPKRAT